MNTTIHKCASAAATLSALTFGATTLWADQDVPVPFNMPLHVSVNVDETGCDNSPGPQITLEGEIALGGLQVQLLFENNVKGTHQTVVTFVTNVVLVPAGGKNVRPKGTDLGGGGGDTADRTPVLFGQGESFVGPVFFVRRVDGVIYA